jgi:hypothetical protein
MLVIERAVLGPARKNPIGGQRAMRRITTLLITLAAAWAASGLEAVVASASPKVLELTVPEYGTLNASEPLDVGVSLQLFTVDGAVSCVSEAIGHVTTNGAKTDVFTTIDGPTSYAECFFSEGALVYPGVTEVTFSAKGKATTTLSIPVDFAPPYEKCVYAGVLKGTNSLGGVIKASFSGKLEGTHCPTSKAEATTESFAVESLPGEELVSDYVT